MPAHDCNACLALRLQPTPERLRLPGRCMWAVMLRALGLDFTDLDQVTAGAVNTVQFIRAQNVKLNIPQPHAVWLTDDQIHRLATVDNPDAPGTNPAWLSGPAPINYFNTHFTNSLMKPSDHGRVHIMVVNTEAQHSLHDTASGAHWFTVAWYIERENDA